MASAMHFFVESEGIKFPDGTIFGAGCEYAYLISHGEDETDTFKIYQVIGKKYVRISDPMRYKDMKAWVNEQIEHYNSCGMKFWITDHSDPKMMKFKKQLLKAEDF